MSFVWGRLIDLRNGERCGHARYPGHHVEWREGRNKGSLGMNVVSVTRVRARVVRVGGEG